jgi:uncharacterized protein with HEPN domain
MADRRRPERDAAYVQDIVDSCRAIESYTRGKSLESFRADPLLQDAVARRLSILGEGAKCVSDQLRQDVPSVDWQKLARLRDKLGHHYWTIEVDKIWEIVVVYVPSLRKTLENHPVLSSER